MKTVKNNGQNNIFTQKRAPDGASGNHRRQVKGIVSRQCTENSIIRVGRKPSNMVVVEKTRHNVSP